MCVDGSWNTQLPKREEDTKLKKSNTKIYNFIHNSLYQEVELNSKLSNQYANVQERYLSVIRNPKFIYPIIIKCQRYPSVI